MRLLRSDTVVTMIERLTRLYRAAVTAVATAVATAATPAVHPAPALVRVRSRRAATFVEYALLAAVALAIFVIFRSQLSSMFSSLMDRLRTALS